MRTGVSLTLYKRSVSLFFFLYTSLYLPLKKETFPLWNHWWKDGRLSTSLLLTSKPALRMVLQVFPVMWWSKWASVHQRVLRSLNLLFFPVFLNWLVSFLPSWLWHWLLTPFSSRTVTVFCVSTGLTLFRDNLRKHLGLSALIVSRNARQVPPANIYKYRYRVAICSRGTHCSFLSGKVFAATPLLFFFFLPQLLSWAFRMRAKCLRNVVHQHVFSLLCTLAVSNNIVSKNVIYGRSSVCLSDGGIWTPHVL